MNNDPLTDERHEFSGHADAPETWCVVPTQGTEHGYCGLPREAKVHQELCGWSDSDRHCEPCDLITGHEGPHGSAEVPQASRPESPPLAAAEICAEMARDAATQAAKFADNSIEFGIYERYQGMSDALREAERRIRATATRLAAPLNEVLAYVASKHAFHDQLSNVGICKVLREIHNYVSIIASRPAAEVESGWLLERNMTPEGPEYLSVNVGGFQWTTDNFKAMRLARREDADSLAEIIDDCQHVREHQWG